MKRNRIITLTTDFGLDDPFVGVMKGVILSINPNVSVIDLSHGIASHDVREAAFTLGMNYRFFPERTVHVVVVDPGVGSRRRPILVSTEKHYFIGPDNGVFSYIYARERQMLKVMHITADHYFLKLKSPTFQGRDVFAPIAAWMTAGKQIENLGNVINDYATIDLPMPRQSKTSLKGEVILIDKFGNAITNISQNDISTLTARRKNSRAEVFLGKKKIALKEYYGQASDRKLYAVMNSSEHLEFFVNRGNAAKAGKLKVGTPVELKLSS